jgi:hypothetical protein
LLFVLAVLVLGSSEAAFGAAPEGLFRGFKTDEPTLLLAGSEGVSMRVLWTVSKYKIGEKADWGEQEARRLLFKPLDMDATRITFDGQTCLDVTFEKETVKVKEYLERVYRTTPRSLGIEGEVMEVIRTNCRLPGFGEYMRLRDRKLIIHLHGVFFYFEPAVNY